MLQIPPNQRLAYITKRIEELGIRFPIAEIAKKFPYNAGNVSAVLGGTKPVSENFWKKFLQYYGEQVSEGKHTITMTAEERIAELLKDKETLRDAILANLTGLHTGQNTLTAMISGGLQELARLSSRVLDQPFEDVANRISKVNDAAASSLKKEGKGADSQHKGR